MCAMCVCVCVCVGLMHIFAAAFIAQKLGSAHPLHAQHGVRAPACLLAAAACSSMYFLDEPSPYYSPIPFMEIHGLVDELVHYPSLSLVGFYYGVYDVEAALVGAVQNFENIIFCEFLKI